MEGVSQHLKNDRKKTGNRYRLRRYTHMIEKGLTHKHVKKEFGIDYIERAVEQYKNLCLNLDSDTILVSDELQWAHDVLSQYFEELGDVKKEKYQTPVGLVQQGFFVFIGFCSLKFFSIQAHCLCSHGAVVSIGGSQPSDCGSTPHGSTFNARVVQW